MLTAKEGVESPTPIFPWFTVKLPWKLCIVFDWKIATLLTAAGNTGTITPLLLWTILPVKYAPDVS